MQVSHFFLSSRFIFFYYNTEGLQAPLLSNILPSLPQYIYPSIVRKMSASMAAASAAAVAASRRRDKQGSYNNNKNRIKQFSFRRRIKVASTDRRATKRTLGLDGFFVDEPPPDVHVETWTATNSCNSSLNPMQVDKTIVHPAGGTCSCSATAPGTTAEEPTNVDMVQQKQALSCGCVIL